MSDRKMITEQKKMISTETSYDNAREVEGLFRVGNRGGPGAGYVFMAFCCFLMNASGNGRCGIRPALNVISLLSSLICHDSHFAPVNAHVWAAHLSPHACPKALVITFNLSSFVSKSTQPACRFALTSLASHSLNEKDIYLFIFLSPQLRFFFRRTMLASCYS